MSEIFLGKPVEKKLSTFLGVIHNGKKVIHKLSTMAKKLSTSYPQVIHNFWELSTSYPQF
jgi:hypothetical protein